jgi:hypothetical protein
MKRAILGARATTPPDGEAFGLGTPRAATAPQFDQLTACLAKQGFLGTAAAKQGIIP